MRTKITNAVTVLILISIAFISGKQYAVYRPADNWVHLELLESGNLIVLHEQHLYELKEVVSESAVPFQETFKREKSYVR